MIIEKRIIADTVTEVKHFNYQILKMQCSVIKLRMAAKILEAVCS